MDIESSSSLQEKLIDEAPPISRDDVPQVSQHQPEQQQEPLVTNDEHAITVQTAATASDTLPQYRNVGGAILFALHLLVILCLALRAGWPLPIERHYWGLLWFTTVVSVALSTSVLYVLPRLPQSVLMMVWGGSAVVGNLLAAFLLVWSSFWWWGVMVALLLGFLSYRYVVSIWHRTHWAVAQLQTAFVALEAYMVELLSVAMALWSILLLWTLVWITAWWGFYQLSSNGNCQSEGDQNCASAVQQLRGHGMVTLTFLVSWYWMAAVLQNILRVTVARVVHTFVLRGPERHAPAVPQALHHATTYTLGSICFGSLLTAFLQLGHQLVQWLIRQQRQQRCACSILACLAGFLERLVQYFHKWSYIYIALYGDDYLQAGQKVWTLFQQRGWLIWIQDQVILSGLWQWCSAAVGLVTGTLGWWCLGRAEPLTVRLAFAIPALWATVVSYTLFVGLVGAAVDALLVVWIDAPLELERNHPGLYRQLATAHERTQNSNGAPASVVTT